MKQNLLLSVSVAALGLTFAGLAIGQNTPAKPAPQAAQKPASIPPTGTPIPEADRALLEKGLKELGFAIDAARVAVAGKDRMGDLWADVQIYHNAVRYPLVYDEPIDVKQAQKALADGLERAKQLKDGKAPWHAVSGPRGYISKIDGSVQPYILSVPPDLNGKSILPLALSCHGRNEKLTELSFISSKVGEGNAGNSTVGDPKNKFVAYLYGRYCCANKLAGEIDLFETWDQVRSHYSIDPARVAVTGFSMGGGAAWHFAAHYGSDWVCATPGAGFSESEKFLHLAEKGEVPPWYESALYHLYNATDHAANFANYPVIAYAGEIDGQKQAGDEMEKAMKAEGLKLERFIGPKTAHKYEPETKKRMDVRVEEIVKQGKDFLPKRVRFNTYSLRYDSMLWLTVTGLEKHWVKAVVDAEIQDLTHIKVTTKNVTSFLLKFPSAMSPVSKESAITIDVDGTKVEFSKDVSAFGMFALRKSAGQWAIQQAPGQVLSKRHGLQGPIDDAFLDSFIIVKPAGAGLHEKTAGWAAGECEHAIDHWRKQFRGEARVKEAAGVSDADIASSNLVLFGDPVSNPMIARILSKLPIQWTKESLVVNGQTFKSDQYVPVLIFPNPLNAKKYVVLNSGFTFRENDYTNNARQTPKLPDYAVVDVQTPPGKAGWGKLPKAGFFGEQWQWQQDDGRITP